MRDTEINDGGPAFARAGAEHSQGGNFEQDGMSVRDYAAIHADVPWNAVIETLRLQGNETPTIEAS
jgi:hypothetical protein